MLNTREFLSNGNSKSNSNYHQKKQRTSFTSGFPDNPTRNLKDTESIDKSIITNSGQMHIIRRRSSSLIALLIVVISSILTTLPPDGRGGRLVDAGLIRIYHKYKADKAAESASPDPAELEEPLDTSASVEQSIMDDGQLVDLLPETSRQLVSRSIEYTSPMKRIMELIGQHQPVIVVSSDSPQHQHHQQQQQQQQQQQSSQAIEQHLMAANGGPTQQIITSTKGAEDPMATLVQTALLPANHMQARPGNAPDQQQWTLVESNQALLPSAMLAAQQQQQFMQTAALPAYEQYYLSPGHHQLSADHAAQTHHLAMLPGANLGFSPPSSYQQMMPAMSPTFSAASSDAHQQAAAAQQAASSFQSAQQSIQQQPNQEDRAQPVFLSSYVPEITVPTKSVIQSESPVEKRPDSIQQAVQYSQVGHQQQQQQQQQHQQMQPQQQHQQHQQQHQMQSQTNSNPMMQQSSGNSLQQAPVAQARSSNQPVESGNDSPSDNEISDEGDSDSSSRASNTDETDDGEPTGDIEEPNKIKRSHTVERQAQGSQARQLSAPRRAPKQAEGRNEGNQEEPEGNSGGFMSYEDKFDSDKDEPRKVSTRNSPRATEASNEVVDGLVNVGLNHDCLQCICRASSGCDTELRCITIGAEEKYCGPFQLTEEYWNKAGKPRDDPTNFQSFEDCANDKDCASDTVTSYMKRYYRDCDGDENVTCMDYARLHRLKPEECGSTSKLMNSRDGYWPKFQRCAEGYNRTRNGDDDAID